MTVFTFYLCVIACLSFVSLQYNNVSGEFPLQRGRANVTVATDGTGNFSTIGGALAAAPSNSETWFVIYIRAGIYHENIKVSSNHTRMVLIGDGVDQTVITANHSAASGFGTLESATVTVDGDRFVARGITFENSAGPTAGQAVALVDNAQQSIFYQCGFMGYQDTLYARLGVQFYRECDIYGTVDFIFGDSTAIFQNCNLYARRPIGNVFTAQSRDKLGDTTGIVFHNCTITTASDLGKSAVQSYLGRPWSKYSRTVVMQSFLNTLIDEKGWLGWNGKFALDTLYYAEYQNRGPGANTDGRVKWRGYRVLNNSSDAQQFTVASFIGGDQWLPATGVPYDPGLM